MRISDWISDVCSSDLGRVLLRMAYATLPGTDLLLSRTPEGWVLPADVRSRSSFDAIREAAPTLARRFAERNPGTLRTDPPLHGSPPASEGKPHIGHVLEWPPLAIPRYLPCVECNTTPGRAPP